jgi:hypothetical protein
MQTLRRTAAILIWPATALVGTACDRLDAPTAGVQFSEIPPEGGPGKVTGGGQIPIFDQTGTTVIGTATFGFNAKREEGTNLGSGHLNYVNHVTGDHLNCKVTMVGVTPAPDENSPGKADFSSYDCTPNSSAQDVLVHVEDFAEPGDADVFIITINDVEPGVGGVIRNGNIQVHKNQ